MPVICFSFVLALRCDYERRSQHGHLSIFER